MTKSIKQLKITLTRGLAGKKKEQLKTVHALGLRKVNQSVIKPDCATVRGMTDSIVHLIQIEEIKSNA